MFHSQINQLIHFYPYYAIELMLNFPKVAGAATPSVPAVQASLRDITTTVRQRYLALDVMEGTYSGHSA